MFCKTWSLVGITVAMICGFGTAESFIDQLLDANTFDQLFPKVLMQQISQNNMTQTGIVKRSVDSCGILPEGEECQLVEEKGRVSRDYKYRQGYQPPRYARPQYKKPAYQQEVKEEKEVISGLVHRGIRRWPEASFMTIALGVSVPFIPFGLSDFTLPLIMFLNYLVDRFNNKFEYSDAEGFDSTARSFGEDQRDMYSYIDDILSNSLALDGRACVKRLICDIAHVPVKDRSFIGHVITEIISPHPDNKAEDDEYLEAELTGRQHGDCHVKYGRCPFSIKALLPQNHI